MRKLALLVSMLLIGMISIGQTVKQTKSTIGSDNYLNVAEDETYWNKTGIVVTETDTLAAYELGIDDNIDALKQYVRVKVVENSGTIGLNVKFQGKVFWDETYTDLKSVTYGGGADTTILFDGSTAKNYRFYKVLLDGVSDSTFNATVKAEVKFYK